jgi:hypothetical protein
VDGVADDDSHPNKLSFAKQMIRQVIGDVGQQVAVDMVVKALRNHLLSHPLWGEWRRGAAA